MRRLLCAPLLPATLLFALAACGPEPVSTPLRAKFELDEHDVKGATIAADRRGYDVESWKAVFAAAEKRPGGAGGVALERLVWTPDASESKNVARFDDVLRGTVSVRLRSDDGARSVTVATVENPAGTAPLTLDVEADEEALAPIVGDLRAGTFKWEVVGDSVRTATQGEFKLVTAFDATFLVTPAD